MIQVNAHACTVRDELPRARLLVQALGRDNRDIRLALVQIVLPHADFLHAAPFHQLTEADITQEKTKNLIAQIGPQVVRQAGLVVGSSPMPPQRRTSTFSLIALITSATAISPAGRDRR